MGLKVDMADSSSGKMSEYVTKETEVLIIFFYLSSTMISAWPFKNIFFKFPVIPPVIFVGYSRITVDE